MESWAFLLGYLKLRPARSGLISVPYVNTPTVYGWIHIRIYEYIWIHSLGAGIFWEAFFPLPGRLKSGHTIIQFSVWNEQVRILSVFTFSILMNTPDLLVLDTDFRGPEQSAGVPVYDTVPSSKTLPVNECHWVVARRWQRYFLRMHETVIINPLFYKSIYTNKIYRKGNFP